MLRAFLTHSYSLYGKKRINNALEEEVVDIKQKLTLFIAELVRVIVLTRGALESSSW